MLHKSSLNVLNKQNVLFLLIQTNNKRKLSLLRKRYSVLTKILDIATKPTEVLTETAEKAYLKKSSKFNYLGEILTPSLDKKVIEERREIWK